MRNIILSTFFLVFSLAANAQKFSSPVAYMNEMGNSTGQISADVWDYLRTVSHGKSARKVEKRRGELKATLLDSKKSVSKLPPYEGNTEYKASVLDFLTIYYNVLNEDYAKIVDMEAIAEESYDNMETYMTAQSKAGDRLEEAADKLNEAEKKFAEDNGVTLQESSSKRNEKIKTASMVHESYNDVYLVFFKSYKQEAYMLEAMSNGDVNGIEQNRSALLATVDEGYEKLKTVHKYQEDATMIAATKDLLAFYKDEGSNSAPKMSDFYMKKEKFDHVSKTFMAIKESKRTQADIDKYNTAVSDYNTAGNDYNSLNERLNKKRADLTDHWNKTASKFLDKHVPRGK